MKKIRRGSVTFGMFALLLGSVVCKALGAFYKIPIFRLLGDEGMGYANIAYTVFSFFCLICTAGVPRALSILTASDIRAGKEDLARQRLSFVYRFMLGFSFTLCVLFILLSRPFTVLLGEGGALSSLLCICPALLFSGIAATERGFVAGYADQVPVAVSAVIEVLSKLVFGLTFAVLGTRNGLPLTVVSALSLCGIPIGCALSHIYLCHAVKIKNRYNKTWQKTKLRREEKKKFFALCLPMTASAAAGEAFVFLDLFLLFGAFSSIGLARHVGTTVYGNYTTLAYPMLTLSGSVISSITTAYLPKLSAAQKEERENSFAQTAGNMMDRLFVFVSPIFAFLLVFPFETLCFLFEEGSARLAAPMLVFLSPAILLLAVLSGLNIQLDALGKPTAVLISLSLGGVVKTLITRTLIISPAVGFLSLPIGSVASYLIGILISTVLLKRAGASSGIFGGIRSYAVFSSLISAFLSKLIFRGATISGFALFRVGILFAFLYVCSMFALYFFSQTLHFYAKKRESTAQIVQNDEC